MRQPTYLKLADPIEYVVRIESPDGETMRGETLHQTGLPRTRMINYSVKLRQRL